MTTKNFQQALNEEFSQQTYGENPVELYEPIRYLMDLGGKRMRPLNSVAGVPTRHLASAT